MAKQTVLLYHLTLASAPGGSREDGRVFEDVESSILTPRQAPVGPSALIRTSGARSRRPSLSQHLCSGQGGCQPSSSSRVELIPGGADREVGRRPQLLGAESDVLFQVC